VAFVINFFLGHLAHPDLVLAAFGVVNALNSLVASPLRNLMQTAQALVCNRSGYARDAAVRAPRWPSSTRCWWACRFTRRCAAPY
jgi:Na+-driven multidrug efflux pump